MINLVFTVPGIPATAGSKTGFYNKKLGRVIMAPANRRQKPWMSHVLACALENFGQAPTTEPIKLSLTFFLPRPKSHFGTGKNAGKLKSSSPILHTKKPDLTKLLRAVEDALTGVIWKDDSQICVQKCMKVYSDTIPGVEIRVLSLT